jgi:hypothetical protein
VNEIVKHIKALERLLLLIAFLLIEGPIFAQIAVKSFRLLENDLTARVTAPKKDQNGDPCAIIKVVTTQSGFIWEPDFLGIISAENKGGEYWLYIPYGAKRLTIKHPQLGILREYQYPIPIEKAMVYEMELSSGKVVTTIEEAITSQWLVINPIPADALIYLNDEFMKSGVYQAKRTPGKYTYRVEAPYYHTEAGIIEILDKQIVLNVPLKPAFGQLIITTEPEKDARVSIDGKVLPNNTPCTSGPLQSGEHVVQVYKDMYKPETRKVIITVGDTISLNIVMQQSYSTLKVNAPFDADIFVNSQKKGTGSWEGRVNPGVYSIEVSRINHYPSKQDIELTIGFSRTLEMNPLPITGMLEILTIPPGADITIDTTNYGITPVTLQNVLIGEHTVKLSKRGYESVKKVVQVIEGKTAELNETLQDATTARLKGALEIKTLPSGANILIDGKAIGNSPYFNQNFAAGNHKVVIQKSGYCPIEKNIVIYEKEKITLEEKMVQGTMVSVESKPTGTTIRSIVGIIGKTPYSGYLPYGSQTITLSRGNEYFDQNEELVVSNNNKNFSFVLKERWKKISFSSDPDQAMLNLNDSLIGKTPLTHLLEYNRVYEMKLYKPKYDTLTKKIQVKYGETENVFTYKLNLHLSNREKGKYYQRKYPFSILVGYHSSDFLSESFRSSLSSGVLQKDLGGAVTLSVHPFPFKMDLTAFDAFYSSIEIRQSEGDNIEHRGLELSLSYCLYNFKKHLFLYGGGGYQLSKLHIGKTLLESFDPLEGASLNTSAPIVKVGAQALFGRFSIVGEYKLTVMAPNESGNQQIHIGIGYNF